MTQKQSNDRKQLIRAMEEDSRNVNERDLILRMLAEETVSARLMQEEYQSLFSDRTHVDLLNGIAGELFALIQYVLWDDLLLRLTRLTDSVGRRDQRRLTIQLLPDRFAYDEPEKEEKLRGLVGRACKATEFARDWRNRLIAHSDFRLARDSAIPRLAPFFDPGRKKAEPPTEASLAQVAEALAAVQEVINTGLGYELLGHGGGAARGFFYRTMRLVEAVQFVDSLVDSDRTSEPVDTEAAFEFLQKIGPCEWADVERLVELRCTARLFQPRDLSTLPRRKMAEGEHEESWRQ